MAESTYQIGQYGSTPLGQGGQLGGNQLPGGPRNDAMDTIPSTLPAVPNPNRMNDWELRALLDSQKMDSLAPTQASQLSYERERAMRYYLNDMQREMPAMEGRSKAVSSDVLDTVEGLLPDLMGIFASSDDVVRFEPVSQEDVQAAQQETDYVNHVFMQQNPGFFILYNFIKDSLLSKNGFVKIWTEIENKQSRYTFYDQPDDAFALICANSDLQVIGHSEKQTPLGTLHDVEVMRQQNIPRHKVCCVPPEEIGVSRNCRSFSDCGYAFHQSAKAVAVLIDMGYDPDVVRDLPTYSQTTAHLTNMEALARDTVRESQMHGAGDEGMNAANRQVLVIEHYVRMNYEGDGLARMYMVVTGENNRFITRKGEIDIREIDAIPMATMSPIPQPHRFFGRSVADMVIEIQQVKTAILRSMLDNMYMATNPRPVVYENNSGPQTLDDLLVMRPGMPIRAKTPGAIEWQQVPNVSGEALPVLQFMDSLREWRTGVSRQGQAMDPNQLQNQVATIANQMFNQSQAKVKLIARIFAETGIKDLFLLLHKEIRKYGDQKQTVRLRNQWVTVDPTQWKDRDDLTVNVGLGTGSKAEKLSQLQMLVNAQKEAVAIGLVSKENFYNSAKAMTNLMDLKDTDAFFVSPNAPPSQNPASQALPPPPNPDQQKAQADAQNNQQKLQIEQVKAQADVQRENAQTQSQIAVAQAKHDLETQKMLLDAHIKQQEHQWDMERHQAQMQLHQQKMAAAANGDGNGNGHGSAIDLSPMADIVRQVTQHLSDQQHVHTQAVLDALAQHGKPKRIRKVGNGEYVTETVQ
jgi:hypothetical protein